MMTLRTVDRLLRIVQPAVLRTGSGRFRPVWSVLYRSAAWTYARYLTHGENATAYLRSSLVGDSPVFGLADIDVAFVATGDPECPGAARARLRQRRDRIARAVPALGELFDLLSFEERDLVEAAAASTITYGLSGCGDAGPVSPSVYHGPRADIDRMRIQERPELLGPTWDWRLLSGPHRPLPSPELDPQRERIAAWLELQYWWTEAADGCVHPQRASAAHLCVKLLAESARIWLTVNGVEPGRSRREVLRQALDHLPEEQEALADALELVRSLHTFPAPPFELYLPAFCRISQRIARQISDQVAAWGATEVRLQGRDAGLVAAGGGWQVDGPAAASVLQPLVDWRAVVCPTRPDETFAVIAGDPGNHALLADAARTSKARVYPTLLAGGVMVRPTTADTGWGRLRSIHCAATDPVSFASLAGQPVAMFPNVRGWSASDMADRAIVECRAWLEFDPERAQPSGLALGMLIACARAALLRQSLDEGAPALTVTARGTLSTLAEHLPAARGVADASAEAYERFWGSGKPPAPTTVQAMRELILRLPAFSGPRAAGPVSYA